MVYLLIRFFQTYNICLILFNFIYFILFPFFPFFLSFFLSFFLKRLLKGNKYVEGIKYSLENWREDTKVFLFINLFIPLLKYLFIVFNLFNVFKLRSEGVFGDNNYFLKKKKKKKKKKNSFYFISKLVSFNVGVFIYFYIFIYVFSGLPKSYKSF